MDPQNIYQAIDDIIADDSLSVDKRIESVLDMCDNAELPDDDTRDTVRVGIELYMANSLLSLIGSCKNPSEYADVLIDLYACKADICEEKGSYRELKMIANEALELMRHREITWEQMENPVAEIMDALDSSVYRHTLLEMLILYLDAANRAGCLDENLKGRARKMLKLQILLEDDLWCGYILKKDLFSPVAKLFNSEELMKIILHPELRSLKSDPVEYTRKWEHIYYDVEEELDRRFANAPKGMGFCFLYWQAKRELLKEKYGIEWRSPSQMNPRVMFD